MPQISKLKPNLEGYEIAHPKVTYDSSEQDSYDKEGFESPMEQYRNDQQERQFLIQVDVTKSKINVRIKTMIRTQGRDPERQKTKEYFLYDTEWNAKNSFGDNFVAKRTNRG